MEKERVDLDIYKLEILDLMLEDRQGGTSDKFRKMEITERGIPENRGYHRSKYRRRYKKKMDQ